MYVHMHKLVRFKLVYPVYWGFKAQYTICLQMFSYRPKLCMCRRSAWYKFIDSLPAACKQTLHIKVDGCIGHAC